MKILSIKAGNEFTSNISKIFDRSLVHDSVDTVLSEEFQTKGAMISLPDTVIGILGPIDSIYVPPCPISIHENLVILDNIAVRTNNLLRVIELVNNKEKTVYALEKSVRNLQTEVMNRLIGKNGIVCRNILGRRTGNTGRAVLLPSADPNPTIAYLPSQMMRKLRIKDEDIVIVGRDPSIWAGSLELVKAKPHHENTVRLHPLLFEQFGADCDGDTVWVLKPDDKFQTELSSKVLSFTKNFKKKIKLPSSALPPEDIKWDDLNDHHSKFHSVSGFSISPFDIISNSPNLDIFKDYSGKNVAQEAKSIALKLDDQTYVKYLLSINYTMLVQKIYLGPVGAAAQKIKLIANHKKELTESANYLSERIQQMLFDVKGSIKEDHSDLFKFFNILDIVNMRNSYSSKNGQVSYMNILDKLQEFGFSRELCTPIIVYLYVVHSLLVYLNQSSNDQEFKKLFYNKLMSICFDQSNLNSIIDELSKGLSVAKDSLIIDVLMIRQDLNLTKILHDPLYSLINISSMDNVKEGIEALKLIKQNKYTLNRLTDWIIKESMESNNVQ